MIQRSSRRKKTVRYEVKLKATAAASQVISAFGLFVGIFLITIFFILFQWKNVKIHNYLGEIDKLHQEILILSAETGRLESIRNELIRQVPRLAEERFKMKVPEEAPRTITVSARKLAKYGREK